MKVVIDSNRVIAALIKDSTTRGIIFDKRFDLIAPDYIKMELNTHRSSIVEKAGITENEFDILLSIIFEHITIIPENVKQRMIFHPLFY